MVNSQLTLNRQSPGLRRVGANLLALLTWSQQRLWLLRLHDRLDGRCRRCLSHEVILREQIPVPEAHRDVLLRIVDGEVKGRPGFEVWCPHLLPQLPETPRAVASLGPDHFMYGSVLAPMTEPRLIQVSMSHFGSWTHLPLEELLHVKRSGQDLHPLPPSLQTHRTRPSRPSW